MARRDYTSEEIDLALTAFALEGGRKKPVERLLRAAGLKIPEATIRGWAYRHHHEKYERIATEVEKRVQGQLRDQYHRLARTSAELSEDILDRISRDLTERDQQLAEVDEALQRLGEIADDDKATLQLRRDLWELKDRLRVELKDLAKLLHEAQVSGGIATEKLQLLTGRPTSLVEHSFPEIRRALEQKGVRLQVGQGNAALKPAIDTKALPVGADG